MKGSIAARLGGDEFVLFLYRYDGEGELKNTIKTLAYIQNNSIANFEDGVSVPLAFSFGYSEIREQEDYQGLLKLADERMYENKRKRKKER